MKKLTLLFAALVLSFTAQATIVNCSPNTDAIDWWMTKGDTLVFADGEYIQTYAIDFNQAGVVFMAAEGAKPVIKNSAYFKIHATTTFIGITFDGQNTSNYAITTRGDAAKDLILINCDFRNYIKYNIEINENTTLTTLNIENCVFDGTSTTPVAIYGKGIVTQTTIQDSEFKNYTEYCIYANDYYGARYDNLIINNCLFHDCAYSAVFLAKAKDGLEKQSCSYFTLTNSTIYNVGAASTTGRGVVELRTNSNIASDQEVLIDHVTLYNFASSDNAWSGGFYVGNSANTKISNCIAMNPEDKKTLNANPYHAYTGAEITNSLYFNCDYNAGHGATTSESLVKADPMFVDAANGDFQLYGNSPAVGAGTDGSNLGDPRWGVKAGLQPGSGKLKAAVNAAQAGDTIVLGDGEYIEQWSFAFDKEGLVVIAAEDAKPVIKASSYMQHYATTTFIGITFDGQDVAEYTTYSYKTDTEKDLTFINCEFKGYTKSCVTIGDGGANVRNLLVDGCTFDGGSKTPAAIKSSGIISACDIKNSKIKGYTEYGFVANSSSAHTEELSIDNCIIHDCGYAAVYVCKASDSSEKQSCSSFELTNSTIYNVGDNTKDHGAVDIRDNANITSAQQVLIDHVTLYNFNTKDWYGGFMIYQSANATISNCIVSNPADLSGKNGYHVYGNAVVTNSLYHNCNITSGAQQTANIEADPLFVDAANANFMLSANSPAVGKGTDGSNLGDTRWGVSASLKGKVINIEPGKQTLAAAVGYSVSPGDTIVLADGTYEEPYSFNFDVEGLVVMAAEGAKPEIILTDEGGNANLKLDNSTTFDGITFSGSNISKYLIITNGTDASKFIFNNCEFKNYLNYAISDPWTDNYDNGRHVDSILINNCLFHDGGAAINLSKYGPEGKHTCDYFEMKNSTIYNISNTGNAAILVSSNAENTGLQNKVVLDHITIYNYANASYGAIAIRKSSDLQITNSIIANPTSGLYAFYIYGGTINNTLYYNATYDSDATYTACITEDPLFVDAVNNNFKLKGNSPAIGKATDGSNLGDPRWGVEAIVIGEGDNTAALATQGTALVQVNREFSAGNLYTIALPFTLTDVVSIFGQGTIVYEYDKLLEQNGEVVLHFKEVNTISAGKPYLLQPAQDVNGFVVNNVTLSNSTQTLSFTVGTITIAMEPVLTVTAGQTTDGKYWLAANKYLYNNSNTLPSLRALFTMSTPSGIAPRARVALGENVETGLDNNQLPNTNIQKVLENGQLIIIRDGVKYNVQGQVIK